MSQDREFPTKKLRFHLTTTIFVVLGTCLAGPLCKSGIDAIMVGECKSHRRFGNRNSISGGRLHVQVLESSLNEKTQEAVQKIVPHRGLLAVVLTITVAYFYVVAPDFYTSLSRRTSGTPITIDDYKDQNKTLQSQLKTALQQRDDTRSELAIVRSQLEALGLGRAAASFAFARWPDNLGDQPWLAPIRRRFRDKFSRTYDERNKWSNAGTFQRCLSAFWCYWRTASNGY